MEPKKAVTFTLEFNPRAAGAFSHELALRVKANPFEQHRIALTGECVQARRARGGARAPAWQLARGGCALVTAQSLHSSLS